MQGSIIEAVYWYKENKKALTAPANTTYCYKIHIKVAQSVWAVENTDCTSAEG